METIEKCDICGKKYVYAKGDKYWPCCSRDCFEKKMDKYRRKSLVNHLIAVSKNCSHERYCRQCGKQVDYLYKGKYCSFNCETVFEEQWTHFVEGDNKTSKKYYFANCNLCGRSFALKSKRSRFCGKCKDKRVSKCECFSDSSIHKSVEVKRDIYDIQLESRDRNMSYAQLQREETLKMLGQEIK